MSDEKKTINVDGLSDESTEAFKESVDACRNGNGKGIWILDDETYNYRMNKSFNRGSIVAFIATSITSACLAVYAANEGKIKNGLSRAMKFIFGKKK